MQKILSFFLASDRKLRRRAVGAALWLLMIIRDIESTEAERLSDLLDSIDADTSRREYIAAEDDCLECESSLGFLESAIEDLEFTY